MICSFLLLIVIFVTMLMIIPSTLQEKILTNLNYAFNLTSRFYKNGRCYYELLEGHTHIDCKSLNGIEIESSGNETLSGVILDNDLQFEAHTKSLCRKAAQKLSPLSRVNKYLTLRCDQKLLIVNSVVKPQFTCCPLIWKKNLSN